MATVWQQVLALDARYNAHRTQDNPKFRTMYIRKRSQLLSENAKTERDPAVRKEYLRIRSILLANLYGPVGSSEQGSIKSRAPSLCSMARYAPGNGAHSTATAGSSKVKGGLSSDKRHILFGMRTSSAASMHGVAGHNAIAPTFAAEASRAIVGGNSLSDNYAFSGMYHIFDQHRSAVVSVKFAHNDRSRVACCSYDGTLSVMQLDPAPATVICVLRGHVSAVTDFAWSQSNDLILSSSLDGTVRLWQVASAKCIRVFFDDKQGVEVLTCAFQPLNNNLFAVGKSDGQIQVLNVSTGKCVKDGSNRVTACRVMSTVFDASGSPLWAGDDKGNALMFVCDVATGKLTKGKKLPICPGHAITSIQCRAWISREARDPCLLVNSSSGNILLFRVTAADGSLSLRQKFPIKQCSQLVRSTFCPLMSFRQGACIVSGSEDMSVYFFDIERTNRPCVNKLQGHSAPVLDVCFNYDESLLASCDADGTVIVWKREGRP